MLHFNGNFWNLLTLLQALLHMVIALRTPSTTIKVTTEVSEADGPIFECLGSNCTETSEELCKKL